MTLLEKYTEQAQYMPVDSLEHAIRDIGAHWKANAEFEAGFTEYSKNLWAKWDAFTVELEKNKGNRIVIHQYHYRLNQIIKRVDLKSSLRTRHIAKVAKEEKYYENYIFVFTRRTHRHRRLAWHGAN